MQAETIELLSGKGQFSMEQALVLAEAIERMVEQAQFVTVPILDARIATVNARIEMVNARIDSVEAKLGARIDSVEAKLAARIDSVETTLGARIDSVEAKLSARIDSLEAKLNVKFERWTMGLIVAMVLSQTALGPIGVRVFESLKPVAATLGH
jgi:hypothetical protein